MPKILMLAGDGIGPEIMEEAKKILSLFKDTFDFSFVEKPIGGAGIDKHGDPFPSETANEALTADAILLGAVGGPQWDSFPMAQRPEKGLLAIRKELGLFANLRPVKIWPALAGFSPLRPEKLENVSFTVVRELTGDVYFGQPRGIEIRGGTRVGFNTMIYSEDEIRRIAKIAFDMARKSQKIVHSIDKANVLETMRFWREIVSDVHKDYPDVHLEHFYVDNTAMQLIRQPSAFDVMLTPNMFGDILSDEAAVLSGSLGMLPSASIGGKQALYEPIHGSAPDIAGQGLANPIGMILSVAMMLEISFGRQDYAKIIDKAVGDCLAEGLRTGDIWSEGMQKVSTAAMGDAVAGKVAAAI